MIEKSFLLIGVMILVYAVIHLKKKRREGVVMVRPHRFVRPPVLGDRSRNHWFDKFECLAFKQHDLYRLPERITDVLCVVP